MGRQYNGSYLVPAGKGGHIVSHAFFDDGKIPENYYSITLTDLSSNDVLHLTFDTWDLYYDNLLVPQQLGCYDYLEISDVKGYDSNKIRICGYDNQSHYSMMPVDNQITFTFVTDTSILLPPSSECSAGFLFKYEGNT